MSIVISYKLSSRFGTTWLYEYDSLINGVGNNFPLVALCLYCSWSSCLAVVFVVSRRCSCCYSCCRCSCNVYGVVGAVFCTAIGNKSHLLEKRPIRNPQHIYRQIKSNLYQFSLYKLLCFQMAKCNRICHPKRTPLSAHSSSHAPHGAQYGNKITILPPFHPA